VNVCYIQFLNTVNVSVHVVSVYEI
jgi:hypothetical protein